MTCVVPNRALDTWKKRVLSGMLECHMDPQMYRFISTANGYKKAENLKKKTIIFLSDDKRESQSE